MGIHGQLHGAGVHDHFLVLQLRVVLANLAGHVEKQARGGLHDIGLVHHRDLLAALFHRCFVGKSQQTFGLGAGDAAAQFGGFAILADGLAQSGIDAFDVFPHGHDVHVVIAGLHPGNGQGRAHVGEQVEGLAQGHVHGREAAAYRRGDRAFQGQAVAAEHCQGFFRYQIQPFVQGGLPGNGIFEFKAAIQGFQYPHRGIHDIRSDSVAGNHGYGILVHAAS